MGAKLLFVFGIVLAHCALAAGWVAQETPPPRTVTTACVKAPAVLPMFTPPHELLAQNVIRIELGEVMQP